jgi:hypothetical protein
MSAEINRLLQSGLVSGYPDDNWGGRRPATRYETAVATHAGYVTVKRILEEGDSLARTQSAAERALEPLLRLTRALSVELMNLGVDTKVMIADLSALEVLSFSHARVPADDPIYETLKQLKREGMLFTTGYRGGNPSRFQIAQWLRKTWNSVDASLARPGLAQSPTEAQYFSNVSNNSNALSRSIQYFSPELAALKENPSQMVGNIQGWQSKIDEKLKKFDRRQMIPDERKLGHSENDQEALLDLKELVRTGVVRNLPSGMHVRLTNYMAADCLDPTIKAMHEVLRIFAKPDCDDYIDFSMMAVDIGMATDNVRRLITRFAPELRARKINPDDLRKQLHDIHDLVEACWSPEKISHWQELPAP